MDPGASVNKMTTRIVVYHVRVKLLTEDASAKDFEWELDRFNHSNLGEVEVEYTKMAKGEI